MRKRRRRCLIRLKARSCRRPAPAAEAGVATAANGTLLWVTTVSREPRVAPDPVQVTFTLLGVNRAAALVAGARAGSPHRHGALPFSSSGVNPAAEQRQETSEKMALRSPLLPPPPPPPAPVLPPSAPAAKKKLYQTVASGSRPVEGDYTEARVLLRQRESSFRKDLQWILKNTYVPSLIQDGPQCGLVALWMAAHLQQPQQSTDMETVVQTALSRGYTAQGEMFSAKNMALLAEEVCGCKAELLSGGLNGNNATTIIAHLWGKRPVLIPYDEDYNHEPCQRNGHKAHWAVASGVLLGVNQGSVSEEHTQPDPTLSWLYLPSDTSSPCPTSSTGLREVYILAKQGKSLHYQLWSLDRVAQSNKQLRTMDPHRASDGNLYIVPTGGVEAGLAGQVVLLHTRTRERQGV